MTKDELALLKILQEGSIIDVEHVLSEVTMQKNKQILQDHPYEIWEGNDGIWKTYLPDEKKGRVFRKRKTKEEIEKVIIDYYLRLEEKGETENSFKNRFDAWVERQKLCGTGENTIYKYYTDYKRFFADTDIEDIDIRTIDDEFLLNHINNLLETKDLSYEAISRVYFFFDSIFEKAIKDKIVTSNPCRFIDLKIYKKRCADVKRDEKNRLYTIEELQKLIKELHKSQQDKPWVISVYAVELAIYTGMRVGELAGLQWDCVDLENQVLIIKRSLKINNKTREYYIDKTKNGKERIIPITEEIMDVLNRTKKVEEEFGYYSEYVFTDKNGFIKTGTISQCCLNKSGQAGIGRKSIHSIRRTFNSLLRSSGVNVVAASALLGHTIQVNTNNYTYDVSSIKEKFGMVSNVNSKVSKLV